MEEAAEEEEVLVPLHSDFGPSGFQPSVLDLVGSGLAEEGTLDVIALAVLMRDAGVLLALPELAFPQEVIAAGNAAGPLDLVGPSLQIEVPGAVLDEDALQQHPVPVEGRAVAALLVDFSLGILPYLHPLETKEGLLDVTPFDFMEATMVPAPKEVVRRALVWAKGESEQAGERIQFYSAEDVPETPRSPSPKRAARRKGPRAGTTGAAPAAPKKRPTVSSLAESLEVLTLTLPTLTEKIQDLAARTEAMEEQIQRPQDRTSALRKPLGSVAMPGSSNTSTLPAQLLREMPPPKTGATQSKSHRVSFSEAEAKEMALDVPEGSSELARAMLAQSQALTTLVSHLAANSADPFQDLSSTTASLSTKGAASRAKLQAELAAQRGSFFNSVLQSMARRMQPAISPEVEMSVLRDRGVTPTQYLERFGGYGRTKDIGFIIWQVALCLNLMMEENHLAAKDALSLLFVCLEQTAMDNGNMQVGLLLSLTEDPPQSLFTARSVASAALPRPFAPTAHQRWVTTALQYLKEMDVIATKRAEVSATRGPGDRGAPSANQTDAGNTAAPKKKQKGKGGGKNQKGSQAQNTAEEET